MEEKRSLQMEGYRRKCERKEGMEEDVVKRMEEERWKCTMNERNGGGSGSGVHGLQRKGVTAWIPTIGSNQSAGIISHLPHWLTLSNICN